LDNKRRKEQIRKQKQLEKEERRAKRVAERRINPRTAKDGDLAEIVPGPQPGQIIDS
jgi:hypothetical protein